MKAIQYSRYGTPDVLDLATHDDPVPGPGEVRIRLDAAAFSPIDAKLRSGALQAHFSLTFPKIPGRDGTGVIDEIGADVEGFSIGDRVCVAADPTRSGTYAEAVVCASQRVVKRPDNLSIAQAAALLQPGVSAWIAMVRTAVLSAGMRVLIHGGSGAVGSQMIQLARHLGLDVTTTCRAVNVDYVLGLGAHRAIAYDKDDFGTLRQFDAVFDVIGGDTHARSYPVLKPGGQLIYLTALPFRNDADHYGVTVTRATISDTPEALEAVAQLAADGVLIPGVIDTLPLAFAAGAHRRYEAGGLSRGRIVLTMREDE
ncbi:NADP-dependent oxidoreductase [Caballeronia sordidicola]|uniref:Bifunctional protein: zinc-containing alcohol dehydrogenase, quinone oxidoreductase (NADPH:quinone reductase), Similar to arginate lyase n=1 Tax=Caballeronia sordidicola TaxID=196367 RepID=A0A242M9V4_CABSO|nr:NADP-dependent oxidoreductase [Caballeronia sordidicola]OTP67884.1 Bifunctional protein: zinc-containing alcohol dehydrogenase, quinone oxidoreductase (NADPH:quinone reductase), Similar to arginate lyase [Caballeronia sordidicola]